MVGEPLRNTSSMKHIEVLLFRLQWLRVDMMLLYVGVRRYVVVHRRIPRLVHVGLRVFVAFFLRPAVNGLRNGTPSQVVVGQLALVDGCAGTQSSEHGSPWEKDVVQEQRMREVLSLVGELKAGAAHPEMHGIHVNHP